MSRGAKRTLERGVADAILEREAEVVEIAGEQFPIAPPTVATLIMVSELVAEMPMVNKETDNALVEVLATARDMAVVGQVMAVLTLGAKRVKECRERVMSRRRRWSWRRMRMEVEERRVPEVEWLGARLLEEMSSKEMLEVVSKRLVMLGVADFFAVTTSLSEANQLRRTRGVETQSGAR